MNKKSLSTLNKKFTYGGKKEKVRKRLKKSTNAKIK